MMIAANTSNETQDSLLLPTVAGLYLAGLGSVGLTTNALLLLATWRSAGLRNRCNALIAALALGDFLLGVSCVGYGILYALRIYDIHTFHCFLWSALFIFLLAFSMELGLILAADRCFAIFFPFRYETLSASVYISTLLALGSIAPLFVTLPIGFAAYEMRFTTIPTCVIAPPWLPPGATLPFQLGNMLFGVLGLGMNILVYLLIKRKYRNVGSASGRLDPSTAETPATANRRASRSATRRMRQNRANTMQMHRRLQISLVMVTLFGIVPKIFIVPWVRLVDDGIMKKRPAVIQQIVKEMGSWTLASVTICSNFFIFYFRSREWRMALRSLLPFF